MSNEEAFPHLVILLTDMHVHSGEPGSKGMDMDQKAGTMIFHDGHGNQGLTNTGAADLRLVVMEFKPATRQ